MLNNTFVNSIYFLMDQIFPNKSRLIFYLFFYYSLTFINAILESIAIFIFVLILTSNNMNLYESNLPDFMLNIFRYLPFELSFANIVYFALLLFTFTTICKFTLIFLEGRLSNIFRHNLQQNIFQKYLHSLRSSLGSYNVGELVGTNTQEAQIVAKLLLAIITAFFYLFSAIITIGIACLINFQATLIFALIGLPLLILVRVVIKIQTQLSKRFSEIRNDFSAHVTDKLNGLFQIQTDHSHSFHLSNTRKIQKDFYDKEMLIALCQSFIGSYNLLVPFSLLLIMAIYINLYGSDSLGMDLSLYAGVGAICYKLIGQLSGLMVSIGNMSRLYGSVIPVIRSLKIKIHSKEFKILRDVSSIEIRKVSFSYNKKNIIKNLNLDLVKGKPILIKGESGKGKSTFMNILTGIETPNSGSIFFKTSSGINYDATKFKFNVGYVIQDIYFFKDTLRNNLKSGQKISDKKLWEILDQVGMKSFVLKNDGLDMNIDEAGRSMSGGQRRRLGIARVLVSNPQVLLFDEILSGLDDQNKKIILKLIQKLAINKIVVIVSHEKINLKGITNFVMP